jgi:hypothetical protein
MSNGITAVREIDASFAGDVTSYRGISQIPPFCRVRGGVIGEAAGVPVFTARFTALLARSALMTIRSRRPSEDELEGMGTSIAAVSL